MKRSILFASLLLLVSSAFGVNCTKYVSPGSNTVQTAVASANAGDVICLHGGTYATNNVQVGHNGTSGSHITIKEYPGEVPVLDGASITTGTYATFFYLQGSYIDLSGIQIKNGVASHTKGIWIGGNNNTVKNTIVDNVQDQGILVTGNNALVEGNTVSRASMVNLNGAASTPVAAWAFGIGSYLNYDTSNVVTGMVLRGNTIHDCWGEGLQTFQSDGALVENNISYDNYSANFYITATKNLTFRRNITYDTPGVWTKGIVLADEQEHVLSSGNSLYDNLIFGADTNFFAWTIIYGTGLNNVSITHNTFINSEFNTGAWGAQNIANTNSTISENIFYRNDECCMGVVPSANGLTFSGNLWYPTKPANSQ
jgi:hypothetical protein